MIWVTDIKNGNLVPDNTKLVCVTNKKLDDKYLIKKIAAAKEPREIDEVVFLLKKAAKNPPETLKKPLAKC